MTEQTLLAEGKTKQIFQDPDDPDLVLIRSKDDITSGDGLQHDLMTNKAVVATETTCNVFELLSNHGIPTHFIGRVDEVTFRAWRAEMILFEMIARRLAWGSYLKRRPEMLVGELFDPTLVEFFYKDDNLSPAEARDDTMNDPFTFVDPDALQMAWFKPKRPLAEGFIGVREIGQGLTRQDLELMADVTRQTFEILEQAWRGLGYVLIDFKIEFGRTPDGRIVVADVVDNDSWRLMKDGMELSKENYRGLADQNLSPQERVERLEKISLDYADVAQASRVFPELELSAV